MQIDNVKFNFEGVRKSTQICSSGSGENVTNPNHVNRSPSKTSSSFVRRNELPQRHVKAPSKRARTHQPCHPKMKKKKK